jgi:hypothetical protein
MTTLESSVPEKDVVSTILTCGAIVKVFWSEEDCEETGWHKGWYLAVVKDVIDKEEALMLYVNNEFECFIRGSKHEKTV